MAQKIALVLIYSDFFSRPGATDLLLTDIIYDFNDWNQIND